MYCRDFFFLLICNSWYSLFLLFSGSIAVGLNNHAPSVGLNLIQVFTFYPSCIIILSRPYFCSSSFPEAATYSSSYFCVRLRWCVWLLPPVFRHSIASTVSLPNPGNIQQLDSIAKHALLETDPQVHTHTHTRLHGEMTRSVSSRRTGMSELKGQTQYKVCLRNMKMKIKDFLWI